MYCLSHLLTAEAAARDLLQDPNRPDAIFATDDLIDAAVIRVAHELGLSIPDDIAVIGYDDTETARALALTTISQPLAHSGAEGMRILREHLLGQSDTLSNTNLRPALVQGRTTPAVTVQ